MQNNHWSTFDFYTSPTRAQLLLRGPRNVA